MRLLIDLVLNYPNERNENHLADCKENWELEGYREQSEISTT